MHPAVVRGVDPLFLVPLEACNRLKHSGGKAAYERITLRPDSFDHTNCIYGLFPPAAAIKHTHTMALIGPSFFMLGLVVAFVTAQETSTKSTISTTLNGGNNSNPETKASTATSMTSTGNMSTSTMNITTSNNTMAPSVTTNQGDGKSEDGKASTPAMPTPNPGYPDRPKTAVTKAKGNSNDKGKPTNTPLQAGGDNIGIIILIVIIIVALLLGLGCFLARKKGRRYSVDLTSRQDDANIPLSTVDPELPIDAVPQNGLQTFESTETTTQQPQEPDAKPEAEKEQKAEADKSAAESAFPAPPPDTSEDKPKEDAAEPSPPAPVEPSVDEKTDDEGVDSNKTSVESLKETNENNSNNADLSQKTDLMPSKIFWDIPLDCPV